MIGYIILFYKIYIEYLQDIYGICPTPKTIRTFL